MTTKKSSYIRGALERLSKYWKNGLKSLLLLKKIDGQISWLNNKKVSKEMPFFDGNYIMI